MSEFSPPRPAPADPAPPRAVRPAVHWPAETGHSTVDSALSAVAGVASAPPAGQLAAYRAAHQALREALASIDEA